MRDNMKTPVEAVDEAKLPKEMNSRDSLKAGAWYTVSRVVLKGATMLLTPIYARLMTHAEYGFNTTIGSWFSIVSTVATGNLGAGLSRAKYEYPGKLDEFISSITFLGTLITLFFYCVIMAFSEFFCELFGCRIEFFHIVFGSLLISPALGYQQGKNRLDNKYRLVVFITIGSWLLSSAGNLLMLASTSFREAIMGTEATDRILSMYVGNHFPSFVINLVVYVILMLRGRTLVNFKYWRYALGMGLPLIPHILAGYILNHSDRIMITNICGEEYTALYSITYTCSAVVSMLFNSLNEAWVPWFNDKYYFHRENTIKRVTTIYYLLFFVMTLGMMLVGPELLMILGGRSYMPALAIMPVVMASCFFQFTNAFFVNIETYEKKTFYTSIGTLLAALINIGLNAWLLPKWGYVAAAYTTLIGFVFLFIYHYITARRLIGTKVKELYPVKMILAALVFMLLLIYPMLLLYDHFALRLLVGLACVGGAGWFVYRKRNMLLEMLKTFKRTN